MGCKRNSLIFIITSVGKSEISFSYLYLKNDSRDCLCNCTALEQFLHSMAWSTNPTAIIFYFSCHSSNLATIPLNPLNCTSYKKFLLSPAKYGNLPLYLRCLFEKAYKRLHDHCDRKCCSSSGRFLYLTKCLNSICIHYLLEVEE